MVRSYTLIAGLAMALTAHAGPIAQVDAVSVSPPEPTVDIPIPEEIVPATDVSESPTQSVGSEDTTAAGETVPLDLANTDEAKDCGLDPDSASSWNASGAEAYLEDWLATSPDGSAAWLKSLTRKESGGRTAAINCATIDTNTCTMTSVPADCNAYEYYFIRLMASRINAAFGHLHRSLLKQTVEDGLAIADIVEAFKLPEPSGSDVGGLLNNIAIGPAVLSTVLGFAPGGGLASGMFSLIGAALGAAASNLEENKPEFPSYGEITATLNKRLLTFFQDTEKELEATLKAIFGENTEPQQQAEERLRNMIGRMGDFGVQGLSKDAERPVVELLKGGEWLLPVENSKIAGAMKEAFTKIQHGIIGNLLTSYQVWVELDEAPSKEGPPTCTALGTLLENNQCYRIVRADPSGGDRHNLEDDKLKAFADYGLDIHTMIRNVVECNNGDADSAEIRTDGSYPKCFFGMPFASRVARKDELRWASKLTCQNPYKNPNDLPKYIVGTRCGTWIEVPRYQPCKVMFEHHSYWTEGGLDRYRIAMTGENIDIGQICGYAYDGRRCAFGSNRQCFFDEKEGKQFFDVNFAKGSSGHNSYNECFDTVKKAFSDDNLCD